MKKVLTVRLPEDQVAELETLASFDGVAVAEEVREAISMLLAQRRDDPEFRERVRASFQRARRLLEELGDSQDMIDALGDPTAAKHLQPRRETVEAGHPS